MAARRRLRPGAAQLTGGEPVGGDFHRNAKGTITMGVAPTSEGGGPSHPSAESLQVSATTDMGLAQRQLQTLGFCVLANILPKKALPALLESAVSAAQQHDAGQFPGTWHLGGCLRHERSFAPHVSEPRVLSMVGRAMDTAQEDLRVAYTTLQINKPGCGQGNWHTYAHLPCPPLPSTAHPLWCRDGHLSQGHSHYPGGTLTRPAIVNCLFMLTDYTRENGGT